MVQNSAENRCISSFNTVIHHGISQIWYQKLPEVWQKKCIFTKSSYNCSKYMKNVKMLGHSSTPPRGQGQFHNGNSAGTVSSTGFLKIFAYEFGTESCLSVAKT